MSADKEQLVVIVVATNNQHLVAHIDQKLKCVGLSAVGVLPTAEAIHRHISETQSGVVMIDALQNGQEALALVKSLADSRSEAKIVVLSGKADLALAAKSILAKASHFLLESTPSDEFGKVVADLVAGKHASDECMFGRVYAELPVPTGTGDAFRTPSGRRLNAEEAIKQCDQFGIGVDEIAEYLHVPIGSVERVTKKARTAPKPSVFSQILVTVTPEQGFRLPSTRAVGGVLAVAVGLWAAMMFLSREPKRHAIAGEVTYQGKPVPVGLIRFTPQGQGESVRPIVSGEIRDGKYVVKSGHGSDGGSYRVQISGFNGIPKPAGPVMDPLGDQLFPEITRTAEVPCSDFTFNVKCD